MDIFTLCKNLLGLEASPENIRFDQMALRGVVVFVVSLAIVRLGEKRFLPHKTAFDAILFFILASMLSRAINGSAAFFPTLGVGFVLIGLHRLLAALAFRSHCFGSLIKGKETTLMKDGKILDESLRRHHITHEDLLEEMRINGSTSNPSEVQQALYERSGEISIVKKKTEG